MRSESLRHMGIAAIVAFGLLSCGAGEVEAQLFGRRKVTVQEAIVRPMVAAPPVVNVPSGRVKVRRNKVVIREKRGVIARVPAVVTSTPAVTRTRPVEPETIVEDREIQLDPASEDSDTQLDILMESPVISTPR